MDNASFEEFFSDRMRERGFDLKKLSDESGVSQKHLEALASGNFKALPPEPYFRGYLVRLGGILGFDSETWWQKLKEGGFVKSSGDSDAMPKNRFIRKISKRAVWVAAAVAVVVLYLAFELPRALGNPEIKVAFPQENPATAAAAETTLRGSVKNADQLKINGELVALSAGGLWEKTVLLEPGLNSFEISGTKFLGGETKLVRQIIYTPPTSTAPETHN